MFPAAARLVRRRGIRCFGRGDAFRRKKSRIQQILRTQIGKRPADVLQKTRNPKLHLTEKTLEIGAVTGFLQLLFVNTSAAERKTEHRRGTERGFFLHIGERTDHPDRFIVGGDIRPHRGQAAAAVETDQEGDGNVVQMMPESQLAAGKSFCQRIQMPAPETGTENTRPRRRSGPFDDIPDIQTDDVMRDAEILAETSGLLRSETGESGIERGGVQREADRRPVPETGKNMQKKQAVLAAGNPRKNGIAVPDHRIISDGGARLFVNFVQIIHESPSGLSGKLHRDSKKSTEKISGIKKKFAFNGKEKYIKSIMKILVVNGPNLNLLGRRKVEVYGTVTLAEIESRLRKVAEELGVGMDFFQSNSEGALVDRIGKALFDGTDGIVINPAAYTHTSVAVRDALEAVRLPAIEVHISNIHTREEFRNHSMTAPVCVGQVVGLGADGYEWAFRALVRRLECNERESR